MEHKKVVRRQRAKRTQQEILSLLDEYSKSDMNAIAFCRKHDIVKGTFYHWINKFHPKDDQADKPTGFVALNITSPCTTNNHEQNVLFAEVSIAGGTSIRLFEQVSAHYLKELTSPSHAISKQ